MQRAFGPVHVNRIGFAITASDEVAVLLDAQASLGGLSIGLTGLEAAMPIRAPFAPTFDLAGLAVSFDATEFHIGGALAKVPASSPVEYTGELMLAMGSFGATAFGSYTTVAGSPSLFAFVFIDAPLGGPPVFFVTGLAGGFGYNRSLQLPTIANVGDYPLVKGAMGTLNAAQTQQQLDTYIAPEPNEDWFAAGVRFTSFEMVKSFALLTVAFGTNVEIALLGESTLTIPVSTQDNPQDPVAEADLLLMADVQMTNGVLAVSAQLSPSSYVLSRSAQLTGGFAFYLWFGRSAHKGDFVVTLGGYNPYFHPPDYYPQVPQLGLNWQVSGELTVKGGLYFALTPSVIMAGGVLSATWQSGDIDAWFDARADFLIRFKPFAYQVDVAVSIGLSVRVNLLVTSFTITVHAGVALSLWGPPFGGTATIDLSVISFTMAFGSSGPPAPQIKWPEFRDSFLPPAQSGPAPPPPRPTADVGAAIVPTPTNSIITIGAPTGIVSTFAQGTATAWSVSAGKLQLAIATAIPSTAVTITPSTTVLSTPGWTTALGVGPLGAGAGSLASSLTVDIERDNASDADRWAATAVLGAVPAGLWQNTSNTMQSTATVADCLLGLTLVPAPPSGESTLPVPLAELSDDDPPVRDYAWSTAKVPQGDTFDQGHAMSELQSTLVDAAVADVRASILSALSAQGTSTATQVDVDDFSTNAPDLLFAAPALRLLGEVPS